MTEQAKQDQGKKGVKRSDPDSRPVDGLEGRADLRNADPTKHYVYVSLSGDFTINPGHYQQQGYKFSTYDENEAAPLLGYQEFKQGDRIVTNGQVLMECSLEHKQKLDAEGYARADAIQNRIRNGDVDPLSPEERARFRGITSMRDEQDLGDNRRTWSF